MNKKRLFTTILAVVLVFTLAAVVFADDNDVATPASTLDVKTVHKTETVYENCKAEFQVIVPGVDEATQLTYEWFIGSTNTISADDETNGWISMGTKYEWAEGTDTDTLSLVIPEGYAAKYGSDNTLVFRCKVSDGKNTDYSYSYHLEIKAPIYSEALAFDDEYQVPVLNGDSVEFAIAPTDYYLIKFAAAPLPEQFPSEIYTVKAGIRVNGELVVASEDDYARIERGYDSGHYLVTEELYLLKNGVKVYTLSRDIIVYVQNDCVHDWALMWSSASCDRAGVNYYSCTKCGAVSEENVNATEAHEWIELDQDHKLGIYVDSTCNVEGQSTFYCKTCGLVKADAVAGKGHKFTGAYSVDLVTESLIQTGDCEVCGATYSDSTRHKEAAVPVTGCIHEWAEDETRRVEATCTKGGTRVYVCNSCKMEISVDTDAIPHTAGEWINDSSADCTQAGSRHIVCVDCGANLVNETLPAGHDWEVAEKVLVSCKEDGNIKWTCSRCGEVENQVVKAAAKHNLVHVDAQEATCLKQGWTEHYICTECGSLFADANGETALEKAAVFLGFDAVNHLGGNLGFDGNEHYTVCACLDKVDAHSHSLFGSVCKTCGYVKGTLSEYDLVERICHELNVSELILLIAVCAIFVILLIVTIVLLIVMLKKNGKKTKKKDAKAKKEKSETKETTVETETVEVEDAEPIVFDDSSNEDQKEADSSEIKFE